MADDANELIKQFRQELESMNEADRKTVIRFMRLQGAITAELNRKLDRILEALAALEVLEARVEAIDTHFKRFPSLTYIFVNRFLSTPLRFIFTIFLIVLLLTLINVWFVKEWRDLLLSLIGVTTITPIP